MADRVPATQNLPKTKFGDIEFPAPMVRLLGVGRHHIHEYPHSPGGQVEKLGRGVYRCTLKAEFHDTLPDYPNLYPAGMTTLRGYYEQQTTLLFNHPSAGQFPAILVRWEQEKSGRLLSGERVDMEFVEDQANFAALNVVAPTANETAIGPSYQQLQAQLASVRAQLALRPADLSLVDALGDAVNSVLAYRDTATLYGNRYAASVDRVLSLAQQLDGAASMQDPRAWPVIDVLRQLQGNALGIQADLQAKRATLATWTVNMTSSITAVAQNIYQDASKQIELLALNAAVISDPLSVRAGTNLLYYPPTPQARAALLSV